MPKIMGIKNGGAQLQSSMKIKDYLQSRNSNSKPNTGHGVPNTDTELKSQRKLLGWNNGNNVVELNVLCDPSMYIYIIHGIMIIGMMN